MMVFVRSSAIQEARETRVASGKRASLAAKEASHRGVTLGAHRPEAIHPLRCRIGCVRCHRVCPTRTRAWAVADRDCSTRFHRSRSPWNLSTLLEASCRFQLLAPPLRTNSGLVRLCTQPLQHEESYQVLYAKWRFHAINVPIALHACLST